MLFFRRTRQQLIVLFLSFSKSRWNVIFYFSHRNGIYFKLETNVFEAKLWPGNQMLWHHLSWVPLFLIRNLYYFTTYEHIRKYTRATAATCVVLTGDSLLLLLLRYPLKILSLVRLHSRLVSTSKSHGEVTVDENGPQPGKASINKTYLELSL